jgi:four helix bundle protein
MTTIKNFEELEIWQLARELVNLIYFDFRECRDYGFKDQIYRAGISIMNNISEGFCRGGNPEFKQFLCITAKPHNCITAKPHNCITIL